MIHAFYVLFLGGYSPSLVMAWDVEDGLREALGLPPVRRSWLQRRALRNARRDRRAILLRAGGRWP